MNSLNKEVLKMSNFTAQHEKYAVYLQELYTKHRMLDTEIKEGHNARMPDQELIMLKTKKLWFKDEIHRIEKNLIKLGPIS